MKFSFAAIALLFLSFGFQPKEEIPKSQPPASLDKNSGTKINWLSWEEALQLSENEPRKIFVDVYTEWCGWCKRMDKATFQQTHIAEYVNEKYYAVKFDAETKEEIVFNGKTFKYVKNGMRGYHELAAEITRGRLSYPTIVFLDEDLGVIQPIPGFKDPDEFELIVTYFGEDEHKKTPWEVYQKRYKPMKP